jgi:hypothetical protein
MTMTQQRETVAEYTIKNLPTEREHPGSLAQRFLTLIDWSKTELEALAAGMHGQTREDRARQCAMWEAQYNAQITIVRAALDAKVNPDAIMAITHRDVTR